MKIIVDPASATNVQTLTCEIHLSLRRAFSFLFFWPFLEPALQLAPPACLLAACDSGDALYVAIAFNLLRSTTGAKEAAYGLLAFGKHLSGLGDINRLILHCCLQRHLLMAVNGYLEAWARRRARLKAA